MPPPPELTKCPPLRQKREGGELDGTEELPQSGDPSPAPKLRGCAPSMCPRALPKLQDPASFAILIVFVGSSRKSTVAEDGHGISFLEIFFKNFFFQKKIRHAVVFLEADGAVTSAATGILDDPLRLLRDLLVHSTTT